MEQVIRAVIILVVLLLFTGRKNRKSAGGNTARPVQQTQNRRELDRRLSEGRARQTRQTKPKSDHSQVFGHSDDDYECLNETHEVKRYSSPYVDDGKDPWQQKREKDPWEL